jgi:hypothetical protein
MNRHRGLSKPSDPGAEVSAEDVAILGRLAGMDDPGQERLRFPRRLTAGSPCGAGSRCVQLPRSGGATAVQSGTALKREAVAADASNAPG